MAKANGGQQPQPQGEARRTHTKNMHRLAKGTTKICMCTGCMRNIQTPPKSELSHSQKQYIRRVQNGTFGTPEEQEKGPST